MNALLPVAMKMAVFLHRLVLIAPAEVRLRLMIQQLRSTPVCKAIITAMYQSIEYRCVGKSVWVR